MAASYFLGLNILNIPPPNLDPLDCCCSCWNWICSSTDLALLLLGLREAIWLKILLGATVRLYELSWAAGTANMLVALDPNKRACCCYNSECGIIPNNIFQNIGNIMKILIKYNSLEWPKRQHKYYELIMLFEEYEYKQWIIIQIIKMYDNRIVWVRMF